MTYTDEFGWDDAADSEADDLDEHGDDLDHGDWIARVVFLPWAVSGDLPGPDDVLRRHPELADEPSWAVVYCGSNDGDIEVGPEGLTLSEAEELA